MLEKLNFNPVISDNPNPNREFPATMRAISFESNGSKLVGTIFLAEGEELHPTLLLLHGFPGNETNFDIAHSARRAGWNVVIFHFRGTWGSEGLFSWGNAIEDTKAAVEFLRLHSCMEEFKVDKDNIVLAGHSMGGFISLIVSAGDDELKSAGYLGGFNYGLFGKFIENSQDAKDLTLQSIAHSCQFINSKPAEKLLNDILENKNEWNLLNYIPRLCLKNILLVAGKYDTISMNDLHHDPLVAALEQAGQKKHRSYLLDAGHSFSDCRVELSKIVVNWLLSL